MKQKEGATLAAQLLQVTGNVIHARDDLKRHILRLRLTHHAAPVSSSTDNYSSSSKGDVRSLLSILLEHTRWALESLRTHENSHEYSYRSPLFANPIVISSNEKKESQDNDRIRLPRRLAMELLRETFYALSQLLPIPATIINSQPSSHASSKMSSSKGGNKMSSFMVVPADHHSHHHSSQKQVQATSTHRWDPALSLLESPYSLAELAMEALSQHCIVVISAAGGSTAAASSEDASKLLYALLLLFAKLTYQGRNEPCKRLVSLGLCEKLSLILDMNNSHPLPKGIYNAVCALLLQLFQCDPITVNACQRFMSKTRIEMFLTQHCRAHCSASPYGHWTHFYSARIIKQPAKLQCVSCVWTVLLSEQLCMYEEVYGHAIANSIIGSSTRSSRSKKGLDVSGSSIGSNAVVERLRKAGLPRLLLTAPRMVGMEPANNNINHDDAIDDVIIMQAVSAATAAAGLTPTVDISSNNKLPLFEARPLGEDEEWCVELLGNVTRANFDEAASRLFGRFELDYGALKIE